MTTTLPFRLGFMLRVPLQDERGDREDFHFGHPDTVVARLADDPGLPYATDLLTGMLSTHLAPRQLLPIMEAIVRDVAPWLGWSPERDAVGTSR